MYFVDADSPFIYDVVQCYECTEYRQCILAVTYFLLFCFVPTLCVNKDVYIKCTATFRYIPAGIP